MVKLASLKRWDLSNSLWGWKLANRTDEEELSVRKKEPEHALWDVTEPYLFGEQQSGLCGGGESSANCRWGQRGKEETVKQDLASYRKIFVYLNVQQLGGISWEVTGFND